MVRSMLDLCTMPDSDIIVTHQVGPHRFILERPDIIHIRYAGDVNLEQFKRFDDLIVGVDEPAKLYLIRDASRGGIASPEVRAYMVRCAHIPRLVAVVTYGSSFQARTLVKMANTAVRVLQQQGPEIGFVDNESDARKWIAAHRQRLQEGPRVDV